MRCERIQELLLTDYIDKTLNEKLSHQVDEHIRTCLKCGEFKSAVINKATGPFRLVRAEEAPSYIWERVKQKIAAESAERSGVFAGTSDIIRNIFRSLGRIPRPAVAFAAAAAVIIAVLVARPIVQTHAVNVYLAEQMDFMMKLDIAETNGNGNFFNDMDV